MSSQQQSKKTSKRKISKKNKMIGAIMGLCVLVLVVMVLVGAVVKNITTPQTIYTETELTKELQSADTFTVSGELKSDTEYRSVFVEKEKLANTRKTGLFDYKWDVQNDGHTYITLTPEKETACYELKSEEKGILGYLLEDEENGVRVLIFQNPEKEPIARAELTEVFGGEKNTFSIQSMDKKELYHITASCNDRTNVVEYTIEAKNKESLNVWNVLGLVFLTNQSVTSDK